MSGTEHLPGVHLPWLERLPAGWRVVRFAWVARLSDRTNVHHDARLLSLSTTRGVVPKEYDDENRIRTGEDLERYWVVEPNHLVVNPMWLSHGSIGTATIQGVISPDYRVYNVTEPVDPRFLGYLLRSNEYRGLYELFVRGDTTYDRRVSKQDFHSIPVVVPPVRQQRAIADFLDRKTAAIDGLVGKKEHVLDLLMERRQALVVRVLTQGLDPAVVKKDSGIEWLGEIPLHWEVQRTRHLCSLTTGGRDTQDAEEAGAYPFFVRSDNVERINSYSFDGEGVLTSGDGAGVGKVFHHYIGKLEFHQRVYLYYAFKGVLGRFFFYYLREFLSRVALAGNAKSTVDSLRRPMLLDFPVPVPPPGEQDIIVKYLDAALEAQSKLVSKVAEQLASLREYRQVLITAAVAGQLDVKEEAA